MADGGAAAHLVGGHRGLAGARGGRVDRLAVQVDLMAALQPLKTRGTGVLGDLVANGVQLTEQRDESGEERHSFDGAAHRVTSTAATPATVDTAITVLTHRPLRG
jgi:hypothetical protein